MNKSELSTFYRYKVMCKISELMKELPQSELFSTKMIPEAQVSLESILEGILDSQDDQDSANPQQILPPNVMSLITPSAAPGNLSSVASIQGLNADWVWKNYPYICLSI